MVVIKKERKDFTEKKIMFLIAMAYYNLDCDNEGVHLPKIQLEKYFGIKGGTFYRILESLKNDNLIELSYSGYEVGKKSQRWKILQVSNSIINNKYNLINYYNKLNIFIINNINNNILYCPMLPLIKLQCYHLSLNSYSFTIHTVFYSFNTTMLPLTNNNYYLDNEALHNHIISIFKDIESLVFENNKYTNLKNVSSLRYETEKKKVKISGRVCNYLCNTKSNKQGKIYKNTNFSPDRKFVLEIFGYTNYKEIFDIKSQIPRLTYILQGSNYSNIDDFYYIENVNREFVKKIFMYTYFDKTLLLGACHSLNNDLKERNLKYCNEQERKNWYRDFEKVYNHFHNLIKPIGNEIFLWSAYWEQLIIKEAREQLGIYLLNVYDGFYYENDNFTERIKNIVIETSETIKTIYKKRLEIEFNNGD